MNDKKFKEKFLVDGNQFFLLKVKKPIFNKENPNDKKTYWVDATIQLVMQKNGSLAGREV